MLSSDRSAGKGAKTMRQAGRRSSTVPTLEAVAVAAVVKVAAVLVEPEILAVVVVRKLRRHALATPATSLAIRLAARR